MSKKNRVTKPTKTLSDRIKQHDTFFAIVVVCTTLAILAYDVVLAYLER